MVVILTAKGERLRTIEIPDEDGIPDKITHVYECLDCVKNHKATFLHVGIHDDGEIYALKDVH